tara:strand:+ start:2109 stop:3320 length:1212 start_codon:yes stop_codon:yes gene_type:complete
MTNNLSPDSTRPSDWALDTLAVRFGQTRTPEGEHNDPIYTSSSFVFANAAEAARRFMLDEPGNVYSRFTNPTVRTFEQRLAVMEGAEYCVASSSGMAAIMSMCLGLLRAGDHVVVSKNVFGSTANLFSKIFLRFGVDVTFVELTDLDSWRNAMRPESRMLMLETPSNPLTEVADLTALADLAHAYECRLVVDNVLCTPAMQRPLDFGADIVVHSATKYIDGQGRCVGGAVVCAHEEDYDKIFAVLRTAGTTMSPFNAWVFLKGLETLSLRVRAHSDAALQMAQWLEQHPAVTQVFYPGLASHPQHELAARQQTGFGGIVAFRTTGGQDEAWRVVDNCQLISITANFGDAKSAITHPATTTHGRLTDEERAAARVTPDLLRLSVGLEDLVDLRKDLSRGLETVG